MSLGITARPFLRDRVIFIDGNVKRGSFYRTTKRPSVRGPRCIHAETNHLLSHVILPQVNVCSSLFIRGRLCVGETGLGR